MGVSAFAAFVAGLVSFLSPCVLPLVPGYISMLSGIGVEQLKEGQTPRGGLLTSAFAFVLGFSIVFITFGASASAVGSFLVRSASGSADCFVWPTPGRLAREDFSARRICDRNRFYCRGCRAEFSAWNSRDHVKSCPVLLHLHNFSSRPCHDALAKSRRPFPQSRRPAGHDQRISNGFCVRVWMDALYRPNSSGCSRYRGDTRNDWSGRFPAGVLFGRTCDSVPCDRTGHRRLFEILSTLSPPLAYRGGVQRGAIACGWRVGLLQPSYMAFR
jgi:hypothetical protein